jgi:predicted cytidylate kinase
MKSIISISGTAGSGKSTIAKIIAEKLKAERIYVGGLRRQLALDKGMSLAQLNEYAADHPETDIDVDKAAAKQARQMAEKNIVVIEGRTQFHFLPESIKLYIKVEPKEGAKRIWQDLQKDNERNEGQFKSLAELEAYQQTRQASDLARYKKYYNLDHTDEKQYDFILDTTNISAQTATEKVLDFIQKTLNK